MSHTLYYGDNLGVMRRYLPDASVDLVYADPPFKSDRNYNVLFQEKDGSRAASQIRAFDDTWTWDQEDESVYADLVTAGFYESANWGKKYPKIQLLTIADLLAGKRIEMPPIRQVGATFKKAPRAIPKGPKPGELSLK